ncbi:MAG: (2Fe-2S)-binding protein [Chloroflexi bacterium]|nr:(2Fe-2S)-binding protein [Chloroflexota bacterium]
MSDFISLTIDDHSITVPAGTTIHKAAQSIGVEIPTICYHDHCTSNGLCRVCVVEVEGARVLSPACVAKVSEGQQIRTRTDRVERSRRTIVEMLAATVDLSEAPEIQHIAQDTHADLDRFADGAKRAHAVIDDNPMFVRDYAKCILCWRCVQVCADDAQYAYAINFSGRGFETGIGTFFDKAMPETTCVFCGQCVGVCPTGALKPKREWQLEQGLTPDQIAQQMQGGRRRKR